MLGFFAAGYVPQTQPIVGEKTADKIISKTTMTGIRHPVQDLFSAHNFDVDVDIALPRKFFAIPEGVTDRSEFYALSA